MLLLLLLPADSIALLSHFAPLFSRRTWHHVPILVVGAILSPGRRMVSSALRAVGLAHLPTFQTYHRLLNRAKWSSLQASRILLNLRVSTFAPPGPLVLGIDETTRASAQPEDRRDGHLSRSGAFQSQPFRESHRGALGVPHAARPHPLGRSLVGAALPHGACPL